MTNRRELLALTAGTVASAALATRLLAEPRPRVKAVAFDGFPIIDPRPVAVRAEALFPGKGAELMSQWRERQFEYAWLRTLGRSYADFWTTTEEALRFAAVALKLELTPERRDQLMHVWLELGVWPDVPAALAALRAAGVRMVMLSNLTPRMLDAPLQRAGLRAYFEPHLSTDRVQAYKPDPRAYQMGIDAFGLRREEILFVASAGWDVAGAKWFGYPTAWVNRTGAPAEALGAPPDAELADLSSLAGLALRR
jgi:2-haloacid dehalogenase